MFKLKAGGHVWNNGENDIEIVDPTEFLMKMLSMKKHYYPVDWVKLYTIALIGSMGSGKTTIINKIVNIISDIYGEEVRAIKTNDLVYSLKKGLDLSYFQIVIIDDAMQQGLDSRQSMSADNIDMSQNFSIGRHIAKQTMKKGILFVIFAIQSPTRLDKFIRENCDLTIYKTYYPFLDKVASGEDLQYVKDFTKESMLENDFSELSACLGIDRINRSIRFWFPKEKPKIPIIEIQKEEEDYMPLIKELEAIYDGEIKERVLKSYIYHWMDINHVNLSNKAIKNILNVVVYNFNFKPKIEQNDDKNNDNNNTILTLQEIYDYNKDYGVSLKALSKNYGKSSAQLYKDMVKFKKKKETVLKCS
jgi:energy-coupling factor transporter ATP-binding protein EcfA2